MNILVLNYEYPPLGGGAAPVSRDISRKLADKGHNVTVITMWYKGLPKYEEDGLLKIYRLKCIRNHKSSCSPLEQYSYLCAVKKFMKTNMADNSYDICHTHFVIPTGEAARMVKKMYNIPYVITAHGSDVEGHNRKISVRLMHRVLRFGWQRIVHESEGIVSPSKYLMNLMINNYAKGNYYYITNGIDYSLYKELSNGQKSKTILIMGRLQKFKNVQYILQALSKINLQGWSIHILGDGPYKDELVELSKELGLENYVKFCGWIDNKTPEQLKYISEASIYISASQFENCPMSVIETAAAGCYPLLSDIPAHKQLLDCSDYFFDLNNNESLVNKLQEVMRSFDEGNQLILPNVKRFDWSEIIDEYISLFKSVIEK